MAECGKHLDHICSLPGRKILLRGNRDMFWNAKKDGSPEPSVCRKMILLAE